VTVIGFQATRALAYHRRMDVPRTLLIVVLLLAVAWLILVAVVWLHRPSRELAGSVVRLVPDLVRLVQSLVADDATPLSVRIALGGLLLYLLSPIDLIPEIIPVVGSLDDVAIGALVLRWAGRRIGAEELRSHWSGTPEGLDIVQRLLGI
jgi:uncharacterized membrane protein YkvA (DUF1232 family)